MWGAGSHEADTHAFCPPAAGCLTVPRDCWDASLARSAPEHACRTEIQALYHLPCMSG